MSGNAGEARRKRRREELGDLKADGGNDIGAMITSNATPHDCEARDVLRSSSLAQRVEAGKRE